MIRSLYTALVARLLRFLCTYCLHSGRYVDYVHQGRLYLRRYAVFGHLTGDGQTGLRAWLPNLYVHQIINPDLDPCLHDHPWPWGVSWIALGGYREERYKLPFPALGEQIRTLTAPALNVLRGSTFHRIAGLTKQHCIKDGTRHRAFGECITGTWTVFLAGPRARAKTWGYLVPGRGYVPHSERHVEFGGEEVRGKPCL